MLFQDFPADLEHEFREYYNNEAAPISRKSMIIGALIYILFHFWDVAIDPTRAPIALQYRLAIFSIFTAISILPGPFFSRHLQSLMSFTIILAGLGLSLIIAHLDNGLNLGVGGIVLVMMFNFGFIRLLCIPSLVSGILIFASYDFMALLGGLPARMLWANNGFLLSSLVSGTVVTYLMEKLFRSRFLIQTELNRERARSDELLRNVLPDSIATQMLTGKRVGAENHPTATVIFSDLVGFTSLTNNLAPESLVEVLNDVFSMLDRLTEEHGVEKIKTVGDAYMVLAAKGLSRKYSVESAADFAIEMVSKVSQYAKENNLPIQMRVGMSTGVVISGVLGLKRLSFDLWGETVNLASRLEASSLPGRIQICGTTHELLKHHFEFESCPPLVLKGIGTVRPHFLVGRMDRKKGDAALPLSMRCESVRSQEE